MYRRYSLLISARNLCYSRRGAAFTNQTHPHTPASGQGLRSLRSEKKGGDLAEELAATRRRWDIYDINRFFDEDFFDTKKVVYAAR